MERIIEIPNPQPEVRKNAEKAQDWEFKDEAVYLYQKAIALRERLIDPIARIDRKQLPDPVIGFENLRNYKTLAEYLVVRDAVGLSCRINFNIEHYIEEEAESPLKNLVWRWGRWAQLETLAHEYIHLWQQQVGSGRPDHGKEFWGKCKSIGLHPIPNVGCHYKVATEPFSILMKEWGIERTNDVPTDNQDVPADDQKFDWFKLGKDVKGKSSLSKWVCPECNLKVRIGIKGDPELVHEPCSEKKGEKVFFVRADGLNHTLYESPKINTP